MKHWTGTRSGWNTRGGTDAEHLRIQQEILHERMITTCQKLADEMGTAAYRAWVETELLDSDTASAIIRKAEAKLAELQS
jgi:hypothetical protein